MKKQKTRFRQKPVDPKNVTNGPWTHWVASVCFQFFGMLFIEPFLFLWYTKYSFAEPEKPKKPYGHLVVLHDVHGFNYLRNHREKVIRDACRDNYIPVTAEPLGIQYICTGDMYALKKPVLEKLKEISKSDPNRPLLIVGIGLGGVLACWVENDLRPEAAKRERTYQFSKIDVVTIAAPLAGTVWGRVTPGMLQKQLGKHMAKVYDPETQSIPTSIASLPQNVTYHHIYSCTDYTITPSNTAVLFGEHVERFTRTPNRYVPVRACSYLKEHFQIK